jgi:hypothetical protein
MRRLLSLLLTLSIMAAAFAQLPKTNNAAALTKVIKVKEYQGWYFSASLDIKAVPSDSSGMAGAAMLQVGKKEWDFIKKTGSSATVKKDAGWQQISLNDQIAPEADKLLIYLMVSGNGHFTLPQI